ncbi:MAG TPA: PAS domain-containing protein, partial [Balneolales bacterium]|nr:PAS domain-containing protein [Balneolales bacterium]
MWIKRFRILIAARIVLLVGSMALFFYLFDKTQYLFAVVIIGLLIIYQAYRLFYQFDRTNRELTRFLEAIRYSDFSQSFTGIAKSNSFKDLEHAFREIIEQFRETRAEKEEQTRYLQTIVQHVGVGLLSFNQDGKVELINNAAKRLLGVTVLRNIDTLAESSPELFDTMGKLRGGDHLTIPFQKGDDDNRMLSLYATEFKRKGNSYTLLSIQDIRSEMEEQELEAWQKLTRVLTHEIMNSITPISSLSSTLNGIITDKDVPKTISDESWDDIRLGLSTIEKRSKALIRFVEDYRKFTRVRTPQASGFAVKDLFDRV